MQIVKRKKPTATMAVSVVPVQLNPSRSKKPASILVWVLRLWEVNPAPGEERLEWFLITNHPVATLKMLIKWSAGTSAGECLRNVTSASRRG